MASGAAVFPQAPATPTWKPPLYAWGRGHTPAISQGPFPVRVLTGIRGPRSGVNSICLCSFHAMSGSVLPATSNFLDKSSAEGMDRGPAKHPWESPGSFSSPLPTPHLCSHSFHSILKGPASSHYRHAHATDGESEAGHRGISAESPKAFCAGLSQAGSIAAWPGWRLCNTALEALPVRASGWGPQQRPRVSRLGRGGHSTGQHQFHLSPSRTGQKDAPCYSCWAVTT